MNWLSIFGYLVTLVKEGKLPGAIRDATICLVLMIATGYIARMDHRFEAMDKRFESIEVSIGKMSDSVIETSNSVKLSAETTNWHGKEIQRHSREIERQWDRITSVENAVRGEGIDLKVEKSARPPSQPTQ